jgi:hypothetical protein
MVAAVTTDVSQATLLASVREPSARTDTSQYTLLASGVHPAAEIDSSQLTGLVSVTTAMTMQVSQLGVMVSAMGRVADPRVRAWTFTLEGHDYYILRLGNIETLVYDTHSEQWYVWGSDTDSLWRAYYGTSWQGGRALAGNYASVVVGDDGNGALYFLDPNGEYDDDALFGAATPRPFERIATAQLVLPIGYEYIPCFGVELFGSIGQSLTVGATVDLRTSDDRGITFISAGALTLTPDDHDQRLDWGSLGQMVAPGRLFQVVDYGALQRVDALEMEDWGQQSDG